MGEGHEACFGPPLLGKFLKSRVAGPLTNRAFARKPTGQNYTPVVLSVVLVRPNDASQDGVRRLGPSTKVVDRSVGIPIRRGRIRVPVHNLFGQNVLLSWSNYL